MKRLSYGSICAFSFLIPLSSFLSIRLLLLVLVISFFTIGGYQKLAKISWDILLFLFVLVVGVTYSNDFTTSLKVLETSFGFFALALAFAKIDDLDQKRFNLILFSFCLGLLLACLICLIFSFFNYLKSHDPHVFFFYNFTDVISSHPTYLAYYLIFAITFGLHLLDSNDSILRPLLTSILICFFFFVLMLTGGQTAFVSLLLVFSFFILKFFLGERSGNRRLTIGLVTVMMITFFFVSLSQKEERESNLNDSWDRFTLWIAAIDANPDVFFGVGTGDYKNVLNEYFKQHNLNEFANDNLNSHNQFIQIYFSNGILGLVVLVLMFARPLYLSFRSNYPFGILVFFPFLIYGMTEVFLGRYQGVIFFAFLHQIFVFYQTSGKSAFSLKEA